MSQFILTITSIAKRFSRQIKKGNGDAAQEEYSVLSDLSLNVERGKITAIIGGNGAGKTTLFNIISCLLSADQGEMIYAGRKESVHLERKRAHQLAALGIGRLFQDNHIFPKLSVMDNMLLADTDGFGERVFEALGFAKRRKVKEEKRKERALRIFEDLFENDPVFIEKQDHAAESLSYGQQRLLGLCRLFMGDYDLVLLDEPTAGVNPVLVQQMGKIIRKMVDERGMSVVLVEHNMPFVEEMADVCAFMNHGRIEAIGLAHEVLDSTSVRENYLGNIHLKEA
ncbi:MAG: ABC transporter ATP-binding protein [Marinifilaceae bacterium]